MGTGGLVVDLIKSFGFKAQSTLLRSCLARHLTYHNDPKFSVVQTQIRLLLEEQSDQGLHCLQFPLHRLDSLLYGRAT